MDLTTKIGFVLGTTHTNETKTNHTIQNAREKFQSHACVISITCLSGEVFRRLQISDNGGT